MPDQIGLPGRWLVGGQVSMCLCEGRCNGHWEFSWGTAPLHKGKQALQIRHARQGSGRLSDHGRMRVIERY